MIERRITFKDEAEIELVVDVLHASARRQRHAASVASDAAVRADWNEKARTLTGLADHIEEA